MDGKSSLVENEIVRVNDTVVDFENYMNLEYGVNGISYCDSEYSKNSKDLKSCMMSWSRTLLNG